MLKEKQMKLGLRWVQEFLKNSKRRKKLKQQLKNRVLKLTSITILELVSLSEVKKLNLNSLIKK
jgi:hypothetical protein